MNINKAVVIGFILSIVFALAFYPSDLEVASMMIKSDVAPVFHQQFAVYYKAAVLVVAGIIGSVSAWLVAE